MRFLNSLLLLIFLGVIFLIPTTDTDFGWHLRCGQEFLQTGQLCFQNTFSYFLADYFWGYSTLTYDLILAFVYNQFGFLGVALSLAVVVGLLACVFYYRFFKSKTIILSLLVFLFFSQSVLRVGFRPQILSYLFFLFTLLIVDKLYSQKNSLNLRWHGLFFILLIIWVNTHPSFILAVALYSLYCLFNILLRRYLYILPFVLVFLVVLINPVGPKVYLELLNHYTTDLSKLIAEWTAPNLLLRTSVLVTSVLTLLYLWQKKQSLTDQNVFYGLFLILLSTISFSTKRHVPLYGLYLAFVWEKTKLLVFIVNRLKLPIKLINYSLLVFLAFLALDSYSKISQIKDFEAWYCDNALVKLPCEASDTLKDYQGNLYTMYEWGGYLIWKAPRAKVFVDGRMPAWQTPSGKSPYTIYLEIIQAQPGWEQTLLKYQTDAILIQPGTFLDLELTQNPNPNWRFRRKLKNAVLYKRTHK